MPPNTKKPFLWGVLNHINFDTREQYHSIFETVRTNVLKKKKFIHILSFFITFLSSLLLFSSFFFHQFLISCHSLFPFSSSFFFSIFTTWLRVPFFFLLFFFFPFTFSAPLSLSPFFSLSLSLSLVHSLHRWPPQPPSNPIYNNSLGNDQVFFRIDNNPISVFADSDEYKEGNSNSIFADVLKGLQWRGHRGNRCQRAWGRRFWS